MEAEKGLIPKVITSFAGVVLTLLVCFIAWQMQLRIVPITAVHTVVLISIRYAFYHTLIMLVGAQICAQLLIWKFNKILMPVTLMMFPIISAGVSFALLIKWYQDISSGEVYY
jgi:hypothetical protein